MEILPIVLDLLPLPLVNSTPFVLRPERMNVHCVVAFEISQALWLPSARPDSGMEV